MEEHSLWISEKANHLLGPLVAPLKNLICTAFYGFLHQKYIPPEKVIPDHVLFALIVFFFCCVFFPLVRRSFSMEKPGKIQHLLEVAIEFVHEQLEENIGH